MARHLIIIILATLCGGTSALSAKDVGAVQPCRQSSAPASISQQDRAALELGHKALAVMHALENPKAPNAMHAVSALGHDQRYYVLVRGWLSFQLQGDTDILKANGERTSQLVRDRIDFVEKAIRVLDLE